MILLGPVPTPLVAVAVLACAWYSGVDRHALPARSTNAAPRRLMDLTLAVTFALLAFPQPFGLAEVLLALFATAITSVSLMHLRLNYPQSSLHNQS